MARDRDPYRLSSPHVYVVRMVIFLVITLFVGLILYRPIITAFMSNPGLNGLIVCVGLIGVALTFRQVVRLYPEINWVNRYREGNAPERRQPVLLGPMASLLGGRAEETFLSAPALRSILDTIGTRLDEARDISRYLTGLLVFLGLLGTFWGLLQTVSSVGATIQNLDVGAGDAAVVFEDLKAGLEAPLSGMGTAFSSSLFGLTGSLILGFLDLQAGQAQNRFYTDLEDWLSTLTEIDAERAIATGGEAVATASPGLQQAIERLNRTLKEGGGASGSPPPNQALANLAEGIQGLVNHLRSEQKLMRDWADTQTQQNARIEKLLERLNAALEQDDSR
ncbi:flagellar motor protein MotA [Amorphus orientalis]|uniref:DNA-binding ferritin-like protein n=1 Tax=Amorphus orientalis TaxID=649198 RepID=A0AAE3VSF7_9HYPH|nr:flagellar motor protein MotA [Amorphus orientalis]MDQ0316975.1 DNA-binding ferritin-like protein [Amorphus orientalis]